LDAAVTKQGPREDHRARRAMTENGGYITCAQEGRARVPEMGTGVDAIDDVARYGSERRTSGRRDAVNLGDQAVRFR